MKDISSSAIGITYPDIKESDGDKEGENINNKLNIVTDRDQYKKDNYQSQTLAPSVELIPDENGRKDDQEIENLLKDSSVDKPAESDEMKQGSVDLGLGNVLI